jgi:hypothetical protein
LSFIFRFNYGHWWWFLPLIILGTARKLQFLRFRLHKKPVAIPELQANMLALILI